MTTEAKSGATHLVEGQAGHTLANDAINRLGGLASLKILDRDLNTAPGSPTNGDMYLIGGSPTGVWLTDTGAGAGKLALYYNGWLYITPQGGMKGFVHDEKIWIGYSSQESAWHPLQLIWSTTEYWTGRYRNGSKQYAKAISIGALPNTTIKNTAHGITSIDHTKGIEIYGSAYNSTSTMPIPGPFFSFGYGVDIYVDNTNVVIVTNFDASGYTGEVLLVYYRP